MPRSTGAWDRNYLEGRQGDRVNAILAAGYNFRRLLRWLEELLRVLLCILVFSFRQPLFA
jgi:hypothetical protein